ncbi:NCS2 family permease [Sulfurovum sp. NBC37-1]|uniref:NCS2 family permease n=1 Tax=Sulfurovum sp. (strain NBC37-1) TaxID=387093 RepID=UPI0001587568|nr:NCS2 family permease [Sulfurovum sp. NBC37-1]BAF71815.1 xanthine/uracil permease [Sulfurovum sp. NBC37-1]
MGFFKLKEHGTDVKTEVIAGVSTFLAMLYIIPVNAAIMSEAGMPYDALVTATAVMTILATLINAFWSNTPVAMSVGMGLNAFFTFGLVKGMGMTWQTALGVEVVSSTLYVLVTMTPLRRWLIETMPMDFKRAVSAGIGAFISFIGLEQLHIIVKSDATLVTLGKLSEAPVLMGILSLLLALFLLLKKVRGAFIVSIAATTVLAWLLGIAKLPESFISMPASMSPLLFKMDIVEVLKLSMVPVLLTFLITDIFDTLGTLTGLGLRAGLYEGKRSVALEKSIQADAAGTFMSGFAGVTSTTPFIESAAGVEAGGRTGLTALVTALLFILPLFALPFFKAIPSFAIYPVLILVGTMMFSELRSINYDDPAMQYSTFFTVLGMPMTYSITDGLMLGALVYVVVKVMKGKIRETSKGMIALAGIAVLLFFFL